MRENIGSAVTAAFRGLASSQVPALGTGAIIAATAAGFLVFAPGSARAFMCEDHNTHDGGLAVVSGTGMACGAFANGLGDASTAVGVAAGARGTNSVAVGRSASAGGDALSPSGFDNENTTAIGGGAQAGATAVGQANATALGQGATANALNATAIGQGARADHSSSIAIGQGAETTRDGQVMLGTGSNTYTLTGVASQASTAAQAGPTYLVTTDGGGNLAASTFDAATLQNLPSQIAQNSTDISNLNTTVSNHTTQIATNTNELAVHTTQIANLDTRVTTNTTNITQLDGRVGAIEAGFQNLGDQISETRTEARAGTALALATAGLRYDDRPEKLSLAGGFGYFKGQSGLALGLGYNTSEDFRLNAALSATTSHGDVGVSVGASWTLN